MAKDKDRALNPAAAARKAEKAKAIKKSKAEQQTRRQEKLARQNPETLQRRLDELKAIETSGGKLTSHEKSVLEGLERDVKAVRKARETLGDKAPALRRGYDHDDRRGGGGVLGKRGRDGERKFIDGDNTEESDVDEDVARIPMPRDTPPPIPKEVLDKWHNKRRERLAARDAANNTGQGSSANSIPLGSERRGAPYVQQEKSPKPVVEAKTVYEAKPEIRDFRKEAVAFVPAAVRMKLDKSKGKGGLIEPEEADALEREGYMGGVSKGPREVTMEEVEDEND